VGVGRSRRWIASGNIKDFRVPLFAVPGPPLWSLAASVGANPEPSSDVGSANGVSSEHSPSRIEPQAGKVPENDVETSQPEPVGILDEGGPWLYLSDDSGELSPEPRLRAFDACSASCWADVLAGEAARDDVDGSPPRPPVEGPHVIPYGKA
jgi:hypothetical protein